jgi:hypothetical protein
MPKQSQFKPKQSQFLSTISVADQSQKMLRLTINTRLQELERLALSQAEIDTLMNKGMQFPAHLEFTLLKSLPQEKLTAIRQRVEKISINKPAGEITLNEGWNKLMLKITQNVGPWEFGARIRNADGAKVEGIEIDCFHEGPLLVHEEGKQSKAAPIFDGKTFAGWDGNLDIFRIEDEAIVGGTLKDRIKRNEFLCAEKKYDNFELSLKVKLLGKNANAGIQIRSRRVPNHNEMIAYQADMGQHYWGCLYDESRRRKVLASANRPELDKALKLDGWNDYVIRCEGKRIRLWINGCQTVDYTEGDDSIEQTGLIGLQIHGGGPSEAWYKDIQIVEFT